MLLPAKFQTPTPAPLGAKIVAITPAPKPHVHQWLAVPDSKIHSRCAECGTVTLTEIVAPMVSFCPDASHVAARLAAGAGQWVVGFDPASPDGDCSAVSVFAATANGARFLKSLSIAPAPEIGDSDLLRETIAFLDGSDDRRLAGAHARSVLAEMGYKKTINIPQHRRAEFLKALTTWPAKHYATITAPDGKVRMVETDAEGWIKNDGTQPALGPLEVRFTGGETATGLSWYWPIFEGKVCITHWRPAA